MIPALEWSILVISAVGIAYQVSLMRVFSIGQWHHFAYMIISIAMLGFGASGAVLSLLRNRIRGHEPAWLMAAAFGLPFSLIGCYTLSQWIPFETSLIVSQPGQFGYLFGLYLVLSVPFFLVSTCITLAFFLRPQHIGRLYFFNMFGSGLGAAAVVGLLYWVHPGLLGCALAIPAAVGHALLVYPRRHGPARAVAVLVVVAVWVFHGPHQPVRISEYKGLSYAMDLPDAKVVGERYSPMAVVTAVQSEFIRETPGQIANYPMSTYGPLPAQIGLYFDAGAVSPISRFVDGGLEPFTYLDYVTSAVAYRVVDRPRVLVIGAGGGTDTLSALWHAAQQITVLEVDPNVLTMVGRDFVAFSGAVYDRPDVTAVVAEGRGYLESHEERFDLIQLPLFGSFNAAAAGVYALNESYLYTVQAVELYLNRLTSNGVLAINCWLKTPPRDAIKLFATAVEAAERLGIDQPGDHIVFIRSWNNATILVSRAPLEARQVDAVRSFCTERGFDLCHCPGLEQDETNRYTILEHPIYFEAAQAILSTEREGFYRDFLFQVRPATDDCPYFFQFFKWDALGRLLEGMGTQWVPFVEWSYLTLVATILQSVAASLVLILVPLAVFGRRKGYVGVKRWTVLYFAGLGIAYMFLEIAFLQRFMLFLAYPVYAVAVVLTAFLVFSGLGSLFAGRSRATPAHRVSWAVGCIAVAAIGYLIALGPVFEACAGWPEWAKIGTSVLLLAPMAFAMGIPFPTGLQLVSDRYEPLVPWAWAVNGCLSVIGATLATFTAIHLGFTAVVLLALAAYAIAALALRRLCGPHQPPTTSMATLAHSKRRSGS